MPMSGTVRALLLALFAVFIVAASSGNALRFVPPHMRTPIPCLVIQDVEGELHGEVPLKDVHVDVEMIYTLAKVSLIQTYKNDFDKPIRVSYVFPMDDRATVTSFLAEFPNGRKLVGVSKEKAEARAEFESAVSSGHTAVLLNQESSEVFRAEVGNLNAHEEVKITISYLTQVVAENSQTFRFTLPTVLAPRYRASTSSPAVSSTGVPYSLSFDMSIVMPTEIAEVSSPTHEISSKVTGFGKVSVSTDGDMNGDFVIVVKTKFEDESTANESTIIVETDPTQSDFTALYVNLNPKQFLLPPASFDDGLIELYFVVDVSGSMMGDKMRDTIVAMKEAIRQLKETKQRVHFNVLPFSSDFRSLFISPQPINEETYKQAIEFIERFEALGGTELMLPLRHILTAPVPSLDTKRRIIVLTDGLVGNTQELFQLVSGHTARTQVFTVGIGDGVSHALVNGLAHHGLGVAEYVVLGEQVSDKMSRQLARSLSSEMVTITNVRYIGFNSLELNDVTQSPRNLPPMYTDSDVRFFALIPTRAKTLEIELSNGRRQSFRLEYGKQVSSDIVHKMAAKAQLRDLELFLESDEPVIRDPHLAEMKQQIVSIAVKYNLMSSLTSYVAVDPDASVSTPAMPISVPGLAERGAHVHGAKSLHMRSMATPRHYAGGAAVGNAIQQASFGAYTSKDMLETASVPTTLVDPLDDQLQSNSDADVNQEAQDQNKTNTTETQHEEQHHEQGIFSFIMDLLEFVFEILGHLLG